MCSLNAVCVHEWQWREPQAGKVDWIKACLVVEVINACDPRESGAWRRHQLELLCEGRLGSRNLHVDDRQRPAVLIEEIVRARVAVSGDAHEPRPGEIVCDFQAHAILTVIAVRIEILVGIVVPGSRRNTAVREGWQGIERTGARERPESEALLGYSLVEVEREQRARA